MKSALTALTLTAAAALLTFDALATTSTDRSRTSDTSSRNEILRGIYNEPLGSASDPDTTLGGSFNNPWTGGGSSDPLPKNVYEINLKNTGTEWEESFLVGIPDQPLLPAPVLVLFHGYGEQPRGLLETTTYFNDAMERGWIVVAPLGAHQYNFSVEYAQQNTEKALDWVGQFLPVDPDRFYAVGFSMGGGAATTYAARHLDPMHARFAAVVNHTGTTSVSDVYWKSAEKSLLKSELMFGGTPDEVPFAYQVASSLHLDHVTNEIDANSDLARNLAHIQVKNFYADGDPNAYLINQTTSTHDHLLARNVTSVIDTASFTIHKWKTLKEWKVLDYLESIVLADPAEGQVTRTLADRDGTWFHFDIDQVNTGEFSPFRWTNMASQNRLYLDEVANIERVSFDPATLNMDKSADFEMVFNNNDGRTVEIELKGYSSAPTDVQRGGSSTGSWYYDSVNQSVVLIESSGQNYPTWRVIP